MSGGFGAFRCPLCAGTLTAEGRTLRCAARHSFDLAAEGYVNLLPPQAKRTKDPGDSREMVAARRRFLQAGHYAPFGEALGALCRELAKTARDPHAPHLLDAGCGEGWYSRAAAEALTATGCAPLVAGFDIAKPAVRLAAKAQPGAAFAVAGSFAMPVRDGWADLLLNIFSPMAREEFLRVLAPGGVLIYAVPGPEHLYGLKEVLYDTPYKNPCAPVEYEGFAREMEREVTARIRLEGGAIQDLFSMTPYYWKTPREGAARLAALQVLETDIQFRFVVYRKL